MNRISFFNIIQEIFLMRGISLIDHFPHTSCLSFWLSQTAAQSASADLFGLVYNNTLTIVWYGLKKSKYVFRSCQQNILDLLAKNIGRYPQYVPVQLAVYLLIF